MGAGGEGSKQSLGAQPGQCLPAVCWAEARGPLSTLSVGAVVGGAPPGGAVSAFIHSHISVSDCRCWAWPGLPTGLLLPRKT